MSDLPERPPIASSALSVVLPARDAEKLLPGVVSAWSAVLDGLKRDYEILLVDDGSTDATAARAEALATQDPRLRVLRHDGPRGFGATLRTGITAARFPLLFYTTCDRQYDPADLKKLLDAIDKVDLVSGFRLFRPVPGGLRWAGRLYRWLVWLLLGASLTPLPGWLGWRGHARAWLARVMFGVRLADVDCAFRLFRRSIFARIPIQSDGPFAQVEILAKANFLACMMDEVPVSYKPDSPPGSGPLHVPARQTRREIRRLLSHPDFGPAVLPVEEAPGPAAGAESKPPEATAAPEA
jgi:glycosyltransferase involved in cell wall biosynthesis